MRLACPVAFDSRWFDARMAEKTRFLRSVEIFCSRKAQVLYLRRYYHETSLGCMRFFCGFCEVLRSVWRKLEVHCAILEVLEGLKRFFKARQPTIRRFPVDL